MAGHLFISRARLPEGSNLSYKAIDDGIEDTQSSAGAKQWLDTIIYSTLNSLSYVARPEAKQWHRCILRGAVDDFLYMFETLRIRYRRLDVDAMGQNPQKRQGVHPVQDVERGAGPGQGSGLSFFPR